MRTILSIDGGGIRGRVPSLVLAEIERRIGRPVVSAVDLVAGTSTGGLIALVMSRPGAGGNPVYRMTDIAEMYVTLGRTAFSRPRWKPLQLAATKYDGTGLESVLKAKLGSVRMGEASTRVMLTAYDTAAARSIMIKSWRDDYRDWLMWQAAYATSAVPTFFPPLCLDGRSLVDGGVGATDPSACALAEAYRLWPGEDVQVISLGTGSHDVRASCERVRGWGTVAWGQRIHSILIDAPADYVIYQMQRFLPADRYVRLQVETRGDAAMDDASDANLARLTAYAERLIQEQATDIDRAVAMLTPRSTA